MISRSLSKTGTVRTANLLLLVWLLSWGAAPGAAEEVGTWDYAYAGLHHFYNLEYDESRADLEKAIEKDPDNPILQNFLTNVFLFQELYRQGLLEGNLYSASNAFLKERKPQPDAQRLRLVRERVARVKHLCEQRLAKNPRDTDALYALGLAYGIEANMLFTLEKRYMDALRAGSKANDLHERLLALDPNYHDAKLIPGLYQYVVGSLPGSVKWLAFLFGYRGNKERGIELLQQTMVRARWVTSDAAILLAIIYTRENQHAYSRKLLTSISQYYPRNPLYLLEVARSYDREGNRQAALQVYTQVAEKMEAGAPGYQRVPRERLYYQIGMLYQLQGQYEKALQAYGQVTERADSDGLLKAYCALRRGEIFQAQRRRELARAEYERVAALPYDEPRREAQERLRTLRN